MFFYFSQPSSLFGLLTLLCIVAVVVNVFVAVAASAAVVIFIIIVVVVVVATAAALHFLKKNCLIFLALNLFALVLLLFHSPPSSPIDFLFMQKTKSLPQNNILCRDAQSVQPLLRSLCRSMPFFPRFRMRAD